MRKPLTVAGSIAALIALKCPICLLVFAGMGAGLGSFSPIIKTIYWIIILALSSLFLIYLLRIWKSELSSNFAKDKKIGKSQMSVANVKRIVSLFD